MKINVDDDKRHIKYYTVREMADKWGVTERRVTQMCERGELKGVKHVGEIKKHWMIPSFAKKPVDNRVKSGKYSILRDGRMDRVLNILFEADPVSKLKEVPSGCVDMILADLSSLEGKQSVQALPQMWEDYERILKDTGVAVVLTRGVSGLRLIEGNEDWLKYKFAWVCNSLAYSQDAKPAPDSAHMDVWIFSKDEKAVSLEGKDTAAFAEDFPYVLERYGSSGAGVLQDVLCFCNPDGSMIESAPPLYSPEEYEKEVLGRYLIRLYTNPGDVVLDNACGQLAFIKAAILEGRNFIGMDMRRTRDAGAWIDFYWLPLYEAWKALPEEKKACLKDNGEVSQFTEYGDDLYEFLPYPTDIVEVTVAQETYHPEDEF